MEVLRQPLNLGPLANNGGPTQTHALLSGSVAIDAVSDCTDTDNNPLTTDQRGVLRPQGSACDVGAYEFFVATPSPAPLLPTPGALAALLALLVAIGLRGLRRV